MQHLKTTPKKGGVPGGMHVPGGWCSKIKKQMNASAGGPDASGSDFKIAPLSSSSETLKGWPPAHGLPEQGLETCQRRTSSS